MADFTQYHVNRAMAGVSERKNGTPVVKTTNHFNYIFLCGLFDGTVFLKGLQFDSSGSGEHFEFSLKTNGHPASFLFSSYVNTLQINPTCLKLF